MTKELRRLEEAKKRIIADAAHELRTPVTLIQGSVEAMIDGVYPLDIATLESMHEETVTTVELIDALRELETIESGELELDLRPVDPLDIARKAVSLFASQAGAKRIELSVEDGAASGHGLVATTSGWRGRLQPHFQRDQISPGRPGPGERRRGGGVRPLRGRGFGPGHTGADANASSSGSTASTDRVRKTGRPRPRAGNRLRDPKAHGGRIEVGDSELGGARFVVSLLRFVDVTEE